MSVAVATEAYLVTMVYLFLMIRYVNISTLSRYQQKEKEEGRRRWVFLFCAVSYFETKLCKTKYAIYITGNVYL
jgi:hypothetical protein